MSTSMMAGQVAVITGGAGGLGIASARRLAAAGVQVFLWDLDPDLARSRAKGIPGVRAYAADVTDRASLQAAMDATLADVGRVDILITAAGITGPNLPLVDYDPQVWRRVMAINLDGVFLTSQVLVQAMRARDYGRIVHISSIGGKEGNANASAYCAAKAGVIALTKSLGKELAASGIRVNCITPAAIETDLLLQMTPEFTQQVLGKIPMGRFGQADEVAEMVAWLSSPACSFSTAAVFDISGGRATY